MNPCTGIDFDEASALQFTIECGAHGVFERIEPPGRQRDKDTGSRDQIKYHGCSANRGRIGISYDFDTEARRRRDFFSVFGTGFAIEIAVRAPRYRIFRLRREP